MSSQGSDLVELHTYLLYVKDEQQIRTFLDTTRDVRRLKYNAGRFELEVFVNCKIQDDCDCTLQLTEASGPKQPALYVCYLRMLQFVFCSETPLLPMQVGRE